MTIAGRVPGAGHVRKHRLRRRRSGDIRVECLELTVESGVERIQLVVDACVEMAVEIPGARLGEMPFRVSVPLVGSGDRLGVVDTPLGETLARRSQQRLAG